MTMKTAASLALVAAAATIVFTSSAPAQTPPDGAALFRMRCASCHSADPGGRAVLGPNLAGVVGRKAGTTTFNYSPAMRGANIVWTRANLDRYLSGPMRMVPGSRMVIAIPDAGQRTAIVNFLATRPAR
jgi:cytochrome c